MLEPLVSVVNFIRTSLSYGFFVTYKIGNILVDSIAHIFSYLVTTLDTLTNFLLILYESVNLFFQDILQFFQQTLMIISISIETIHACLLTVFIKITLYISLVTALISSIFHNAFNVISLLLTSITELLVLLKTVLVLFGSGVWFIVLSVPMLPYCFCKLCLSIIYIIYKEFCDICNSGISNVKSMLRDTCYFILDVPLESLAGIVIASCLVYIFSQFYIIIISFLKIQLRKCQNWIRNQRLLLRVSLGTHFPNQIQRPRGAPLPQLPLTISRAEYNRELQIEPRQLVRSPQEIQIKHARTTSRTDDKCCVICQERSKCILLLPCRHLCLCTECTRELRYYNEVCPICRTNIESTMKIFI